MPRPAALSAAGAVLAAAGLIAGPVAAVEPPNEPGPGRELALTFEPPQGRVNAGTARLEVDVLSHNGGLLTAGSGGGSLAVRTPEYRGRDASFALLTARDTSGGDILSPGAVAFAFGGDFAIDAVSQGGPHDDGNNLIQRGLFGASMQYKIEIDRNRPSCRVKGDDGAVVVRSDQRVTPGTWYRVRCLRDGSTVTLQLTRRSDGETWTSSEQGPTGALRAPSAALPLSVGGKVDPRGAIQVEASDQFNGLIDNAFYNVWR